MMKPQAEDLEARQVLAILGKVRDDTSFVPEFTTFVEDSSCLGVHDLDDMGDDDTGDDDD